MTRISLKEAYDNRDVIAQIARLNDIVADLPNPDLTNVVLKTGNQVIDGVKTFNDQIVAAGGIDFNGSVEIIGDLQVDGDIIQTGAAYETHAQQIYTTNDYIVTRDGAVSGIPSGQYSGIQVHKYDGVNDSRLVIDNAGVARVGDINDEQPLATRDEAGSMTSGALVKWDGVNEKLITSSANVGSDDQPVKIVNGEPVAVSGALQSALSVVDIPSGNAAITVKRYGKIVSVMIKGFSANSGDQTPVTGLPLPYSYVGAALVTVTNTHGGGAFIDTGATTLHISNSTGSTTNLWGTLNYITQE